MSSWAQGERRSVASKLVARQPGEEEESAPEAALWPRRRLKKNSKKRKRENLCLKNLCLGQRLRLKRQKKRKKRKRPKILIHLKRSVRPEILTTLVIGDCYVAADGAHHSWELRSLNGELSTHLEERLAQPNRSRKSKRPRKSRRRRNRHLEEHRKANQDIA